MSEIYEIHIGNRLSSRWTHFFDGIGISHQDDGTTVLTGEFTDQAALHGLLAKVRDLGLPLLNVKHKQNLN